MVDQGHEQGQDEGEQGPAEPALSASPGRVRRFGRRRQANAVGGRTKAHLVRTTEAEAAALAARAAAVGVSVPRLMVESALADPGRSQTTAQRHEAMVELLALRRLMAGLANNANQVARHANATGEVPSETAAVMAAARRTAGRIDEVLAGLSDAGPRRGWGRVEGDERVMSRAREDAAAAVAGDAEDRTEDLGAAVAGQDEGWRRWAAAGQ